MIRLGDGALLDTANAFNANFECPANNDGILGFKCPFRYDFGDFLDHFVKDFHTCLLVLFSSFLVFSSPSVAPTLLVVLVLQSSFK